jgi:hypothetical protein
MSAAAKGGVAQVSNGALDTVTAPWGGWDGFKDAVTCASCGMPGDGSIDSVLVALPAFAPMMANFSRGAAAANTARGTTTVYQSVTATGRVQYVGITNNIVRRAAEHLRTSGIAIEKVLGGLRRGDARAIEQALIDYHGLSKNGGTLLNRINSISPLNPNYNSKLARGYELLQSAGIIAPR